MRARPETNISSPPRSGSVFPNELGLTSTAHALLADVAAGDRRAFEQLYDMLVTPLFGLLTRVVRDRAQVEEVAREVLVEVWRTAPGYRPEQGSPLTWVLTLAHRRAVDRVRSAQVSFDRDAKVAAGEQSGPAAELIFARGEHQQVQQALTSLTEPQQHALAITYYHGYTCRDAADLFGIPTSAVKTRVRDALIRLRDSVTSDPDATARGNSLS